MTGRKLIAYETVPADGYELVTAPHGRDWMDATYDRSAYRCLPLLMANQGGWMILSPTTVRVKWDGGLNLDAVELERWQEPPRFVSCPPDCELGIASHIHAAVDEPRPDYLYPMSHFGSGIITWTLPFLFRTPEGYNLLVRGPANSPKDGVAPLEGVVETDWTPATFTMNWKITRADTWITFGQGEPLAMIVPQRRGELEDFTPRILPLADDSELEASNAAWCASRDKFNAEFVCDPGVKQGWERHYFQGTAPDGTAAQEHQTRIRLRSFTR